MRRGLAHIICMGGLLVGPAQGAWADQMPPMPSDTPDCIAAQSEAVSADYRSCAGLSTFACSEGMLILICSGQEIQAWARAIAAQEAEVLAFIADYEAEWPMRDQFEQATAAWNTSLAESCGFAGRIMLGGSGEQPEEAFCTLNLMADRMNYFAALGF